MVGGETKRTPQTQVSSTKNRPGTSHPRRTPPHQRVAADFEEGNVVSFGPATALAATCTDIQLVFGSQQPQQSKINTTNSNNNNAAPAASHATSNTKIVLSSSLVHLQNQQPEKLQDVESQQCDALCFGSFGPTQQPAAPPLSNSSIEEIQVPISTATSSASASPLDAGTQEDTTKPKPATKNAWSKPLFAQTQTQTKSHSQPKSQSPARAKQPLTSQDVQKIMSMSSNSLTDRGD